MAELVKRVDQRGGMLIENAGEHMLIGARALTHTQKSPDLCSDLFHRGSLLDPC